MQTLALDYFKLAALAFGGRNMVPPDFAKLPGVREHAVVMGGVTPTAQRKALPRPGAAPQPSAGIPMPGSGTTNYKICGVGAMLRPTASLLNPTSMGAKNFMSGAEKHLKIEPTSNVRPETKPDVPGSVGITRPTKAASALAYFAMTA